MVFQISTQLQTQGFVQSKKDYSLFIKREGDQLTLAAIYVDDIILTGNHTPTILALKNYLHTTFSIKDLGALSFFLGMEICRTFAGIILSNTNSQGSYFNSLVLIYPKEPLLHCPHLANYIQT